MKLGNFSLSLAVKDIHASFQFYRKLGFSQFGGNIDQKWLILKNENCMIGLFEGMLEKNSLTFNPGWDANAQEVNPFEDVREIQKKIQDAGIALIKEANTSSEGPEYITLEDPDGNPILIDQHR